MTIRGLFTNYAAPAVRAWLSFPETSPAVTEVRFLLDTGASFSVLHPNDASKLRVVIESDATRIGGRGIGGRAEYVERDARLSFTQVDGSAIHFRLPLRVAVPTPENTDYPSFLGMDFISYFKLCVSLNDRLVELE